MILTFAPQFLHLLLNPDISIMTIFLVFLTLRMVEMLCILRLASNSSSFFMMMKPWFPQNAPDPNLSRPVTSPPFADNATRVQVLARFLPTMAWNNTGTQYREQKLNFPPKFDACNFTFSWPHFYLPFSIFCLGYFPRKKSFAFIVELYIEYWPVRCGMVPRDDYDVK